MQLKVFSFLKYKLQLFGWGNRKSRSSQQIETVIVAANVCHHQISCDKRERETPTFISPPSYFSQTVMCSHGGAQQVMVDKMCCNMRYTLYLEGGEQGPVQLPHRLTARPSGWPAGWQLDTATQK